jgi:cell division protease FtsH
MDAARDQESNPGQKSDRSGIENNPFSKLIKKKDPEKNSSPDQGPSGGKRPWQFSIVYFLAFFLALYLFNSLTQEQPQTIQFSEFKQKVTAGEIKQVQISDNLYIGHSAAISSSVDSSRSSTNNSGKTYRTIPVNDPTFIPLLDSKNVSYSVKPTSIFESVGSLIFSWVLPLAMIMALWWFLSNRMKGGMGGVMSFGKNRAKLVSEGDTGVTFEDVAGVEEAKEELVEVVDFLMQPEKYEAIGGKIPKGVLLVGPPGTGKTLMAKAVAGEAKVPFFKISGADFVELFVGVGAARVRDLFQQARENSPCIIFIDELDAIGKSRGNGMAGNDEREQTLNQLLVEMDGFDARGGVIIIAATNRPEVLDAALLRPGRFDRQVLVDRPDMKGREMILKIHAKDVKLDQSIDLTKIAVITAGFAGADLANLVNEAAILAVRSKRDRVLQEDFDEAIEKLVAGLKKKNRVINEKEKQIVAYHETGHALVAAYTPDSEPVQKISIIPRGFGALGYTLQMPTEDRFLITTEELLGKIDVLLGGRAAEQLTFGRISNGAANDIARATDMVRKMITEYGMSEKFKNVYLGKGQQGMMGQEDPMTSPPWGQKSYSEDTQKYIDGQIAKTIDERYGIVLNLLREKRDLLQQISKRLLDKEVIGADEFAEFVKQAGTSAEKAQPQESSQPSVVG